MSDLFARLIDRARGTAAIVRPRVATAYEAAADAGEPLAEVHDPVEPVFRPPVDHVRDVEPRPRPREAVQRERTRDGHPTVPPEPPVPHRRQPLAGGDAVPTIREIVRMTEASHDVPPPPAARVPAAADAPILAPADPPPARETVRAVEHTRVEHTIERIHDGSRGIPGAERPADHEIAGTRVEPLDIRPVRPAPPDAPRLPPESTPAPSEPPVVRVTIGRVDVRAMHDAPRERRRPAQQPSRRMDLDEYLRRRNGDA